MFTQKTRLFICCPISTSIRGTKTEVSINILKEKSVVVTNIIQTLSWEERKVRFVGKVDINTFKAVLQRILPFIGAETL